MEYLAHINDEAIQTVSEHSLNTAEMAKDFAVDYLKNIAYMTGLMHDIGKYQESFQKRIHGDDKIRVEHAICGAKEVKRVYRDEKVIELMMEFCIAGHHTGIPDGGSVADSANDSSLSGRLLRGTEDYAVYKNEMSLLDLKEDNLLLSNLMRKGSGKNKGAILDIFSFFTRYLFSCLTDADSIDTATFCTGVIRECVKADYHRCLEDVNKRLNGFNSVTELQKARTRLQLQALNKVETDADIYLLNLPTGGGKTLCSIKFALERAIRKNKKHIIYVIPYNSIIDQTVSEMTEMFSAHSSVLQHSSSFDYKEIKDEDYRNIIKLSSENWDADLIVTTAVQFFESIYGNKRKKLRKLHNMADSIIVFDEVHMMPLDYLQPCLQAVSCLTSFLNSEALFLTATMPDFESLLQRYTITDNAKILNLVSDFGDFKYFKKCRYVFDGELTDDVLLERTMARPSTLIIVNKKKTAQALFEACNMLNKYHLSTYMTAKDRTETISEIKRKLKEISERYPDIQNVPETERIIVFSTSLVEAGVDFDFTEVYRELTGLPSIIQSGGRCNREGKLADAITHVFVRSDDEHKMQSKADASITKRMLQEKKDVTDQECIKEYYSRVYDMEAQSIIKHSMQEMCKKPGSIPFAEYAKQFQLIDSRTESIVVPEDDRCIELIDRLKYSGIASERDFQKYTCSVSVKELELLMEQGVLEDYGTGMNILTNMDYYSKTKGIQFTGNDYYI